MGSYVWENALRFRSCRIRGKCQGSCHMLFPAPGVYEPPFPRKPPPPIVYLPCNQVKQAGGWASFAGSPSLCLMWRWSPERWAACWHWGKQYGLRISEGSRTLTGWLAGWLPLGKLWLMGDVCCQNLGLAVWVASLYVCVCFCVLESGRRKMRLALALVVSGAKIFVDPHPTFF